MTGKLRQIRLTAHKAIYNKDISENLESILRSIKKKSNGHQDRTSSSPNQKNTVISKFTETTALEAIGAALDVYEPGSSISTLLFHDDQQEVTDGTLPPPEKAEFLDGRISILVVGDHVICAGLGNRSSTVSDAIREIAKRQNIIDANTLIKLVRLPSPDVIARINRVGVKSVTFDASEFLGRGISDKNDGIIGSIFGQVASANALTRRRKSAAKLTIRSRTKLSKGSVELDPIDRDKWIDGIAVQAIKENNISTYTIMLNDKTPIRSDTIEINKTILVARSGTTFDTATTHHEMVQFYKEILTEMERK